jgi:hypothetical protein
MKSLRLNLARVLLVVVFGLAPLLPPCSADAICAMPCCGQGALHAGGASDPLPDSGCCPAPGQPPRQIAESCGAGPGDLDVHPLVSGAFLSVALPPAQASNSSPAAPNPDPWSITGFPSATKTPLYLRVLTLRI